MVFLRRLPRWLLLAGSLAWIVAVRPWCRRSASRTPRLPPLWPGPSSRPAPAPASSSASPALRLPAPRLAPDHGPRCSTAARSSRRPVSSVRARVVPLLCFPVGWRFFFVQRLLNGYGNFGLAAPTRRSSAGCSEQVSAEPGLRRSRARDPLSRARRRLRPDLAPCAAPGRPIVVFGQTALFFYVLARASPPRDRARRQRSYKPPPCRSGRPTPPRSASSSSSIRFCRWYRGYKARHPFGWARYV